MKTINWPDLIINSELNKIPFEEVNIITLKAYYQQLVDMYVIDNLATPTLDSDSLAEDIREKSKSIMNSGTISCRQFIEKHPKTGVTICVDVEEIIESTIIQALDLLVKPEIDWSEERVEFGPSKSFRSFELRTYG